MSSKKQGTIPMHLKFSLILTSDTFGDTAVNIPVSIADDQGIKICNIAVEWSTPIGIGDTDDRVTWGLGTKDYQTMPTLDDATVIYKQTIVRTGAQGAAGEEWEMETLTHHFEFKPWEPVFQPQLYAFGFADIGAAGVTLYFDITYVTAYLDSPELMSLLKSRA